MHFLDRNAIRSGFASLFGSKYSNPILGCQRNALERGVRPTACPLVWVRYHSSLPATRPNWVRVKSRAVKWKLLRYFLKELEFVIPKKDNKYMYSDAASWRGNLLHDSLGEVQAALWFLWDDSGKQAVISWIQEAQKLAFCTNSHKKSQDLYWRNPPE